MQSKSKKRRFPERFCELSPSSSGIADYDFESAGTEGVYASTVPRCNQSLSTVIGSSRDARHAGNRLAQIDTPSSIVATIPSVSGSVALTP